MISTLLVTSPLKKHGQTALLTGLRPYSTTAGGAVLPSGYSNKYSNSLLTILLKLSKEVPRQNDKSKRIIAGYLVQIPLTPYNNRRKSFGRVRWRAFDRTRQSAATRLEV